MHSTVNYIDDKLDGQWDIIATFGMSDEIVLEQFMELPIAKVMIVEYYAPLYAHKAILSVRRRQRNWRNQPHVIVGRGKP